MPSYPVADLHCDLLDYLAAKDEKGAFNPEARCAFPQMQEGGVFFQVLAIFTQTSKKAPEEAEKQFQIYKKMGTLYPGKYIHQTQLQLPSPSKNVATVIAIENASGLCGEEEPLEKAFERLNTFQSQAGPLCYLSLTWNTENRFGGGNETKIGLKTDGEALLEALSEKKIAIDFSHTSDALAHDILNMIDKRGLPLVPIASHSNFRTVQEHPRNLPDEIAQEIFARGGIVGLNVIKPFIGTPFTEHFLSHVQHAEKLGGKRSLCLGADFFFEGGMLNRLHVLEPLFAEEFGNASRYPKLFELLSSSLSHEEIEGIAYQNLGAFFSRREALTCI